MVDKFTLNANQAKVDRHFARIQAESDPILIEYEEQHQPTEVIDMHFPEVLRDEVLKDVEYIKMVERKMWEVMDTQVSGYTIFSLAFENVMLFLPACIDFMDKNREMVKAKLPWMDTCTCNIFNIGAGNGRKAYGTHKASSLGHRNKHLAPRQWLSPLWQMSFHTAVTPTNSSASPFVIFDEHVPSSMNDDYLIDYLMRADLDPDVRESVKRAATALHPRLASTSDLYPKMPTNLRPALRNFLFCLYLMEKSCPDPSKWGGIGTYWELDVGQALYFNNWRVHSDSGLMDLPHVSDEQSRVSLDLRCYSEVPVPWPFHSDWEFYAAFLPKLAIYEELAIECISRMFNYTSRWEFLETVFPGNKLDNVMGSVGSVILQHAAGGRHSLLSEEAVPGMRRHFLRLKESGGNVNYAAFQSCYADYKVEFENPSTVDISAHFSAKDIFVRSAKYRIFLARMMLGGQTSELLFVAACVAALLMLLAVCCCPRKRKVD